ncbi:MAG: glutamate-5-semialdehyde dehydrogenase [Chitinivibrionales bacterium]|nr:glutamate-5-semialdehyde dehydrogenase [Chitinivibrionales bacterium]
MAKQSPQKIVDKLAGEAKDAALQLQSASQRKVNKALTTMATLCIRKKAVIQKENRKDLAAAKKKGLSDAMINRLTLSDKVINSMVEGLKVVSKLSTPIGRKFDRRVRPNKLEIYKMKVPIGVVGIIYESRPNVTVDAAAICLKSQNAVILRGGSEAIHSNRILTDLFSQALRTAGLPKAAVQIIPITDRAAVNELLQRDDHIDVIIPRGGEALIKTVVENSRIPVIKHYKGVCHVYISKRADMEKAMPIAVNAKVQRPGVCNAMETLLLDAGLSHKKKHALIEALLENNVTLCGDKESRKLSPRIKAATKADWEAEYLDLRLAVKIVDGVAGAIDHINTFGSHHTDAIVSESKKEIDLFRTQIDSSSVMVNASTRFSDGGEYGMGCEIGISTDKLHARGPMGVEDLVTYKWIAEGNGQIRE